MLGQFTLIYVNLDFSLAETFYLVEHQLDNFFAPKLDRSLCPVISPTVSYFWLIAACAAARRAIGTRNGEQDT